MPHKYSLKSMRLSKSKRHSSPKAIEERPRYPWGLEINLNQDALKKLGKKAEDFSVGSEIYVLAKAKVTGIRVSDNMNDSSRNIDLQVTNMEIQDHGKTTRNTNKSNPHKKY